MIPEKTYEEFEARCRASASSIPIRRGGQSTTLDKLSEADRRTNIWRWWESGIDPTPQTVSGTVVPTPSEKPTGSDKLLAEVRRYAGSEPPPRTPPFVFAERDRPSARAPSVELPLEYWVGWVVRPYDGGWKLRTVRIPLHVLEMFATDPPTPADRREIVVAKIGVAAAHPSLTTATDWGTPIGFSKDPADPETVEMVDHYELNQLGMMVPVYRQVPKAEYLALAEQIRANHPLRPA